MGTPTKTIPEIPHADTIGAFDQFLAKFTGATKPNKINWATMVSTALSGLPPGYLFSSTPPPTTTPAPTTPPPTSSGYSLTVDSVTSKTINNGASVTISEIWSDSGNPTTSGTMHVMLNSIAWLTQEWISGISQDSGSVTGTFGPTGGGATVQYGTVGTYTFFIRNHTASGDKDSNTVTVIVQ